MNAIELFIAQNKSFSVKLLLSALSRISLIQVTKGWLSFKDILEAIIMASFGIALSDGEEEAYSGLMFEAIVIPLMTASGPRLGMNKIMIGNEHLYLERILGLVKSSTQKLQVNDAQFTSNTTETTLQQQIQMYLTLCSGGVGTEIERT